jgi:hypothetical protein
VGFGDADREGAEAVGLEEIEGGGGRGQDVDSIGPVDGGGDGLELRPQGRLVRIEEAEVSGLVGRRRPG